MENLTRRSFVGVAGAAAAAGLAAAGTAAVSGQAVASEAAPEAEAAEKNMYTFNGGPLTSAEQHALLSEYDWRESKLTVAEIAEAAKNVSDDEARAILFNEPQITEDFVKSDGTVVPAIYVQLRNRINRIGLGIGSEINENVFDFLMQEVTPEEAAFYCAVPMFRFFNDEEAGEAAGMETADARAMADALSYRGWLNRATRCGVNFYHTLAFAHGILEFTLDRYCAGAEGKEDYVKGIFSIRGDDYGYVSRNLGSAMYFPVPVNENIVAETKILPYFDWDEIIERNEVIAVMPCQCRTFTSILQGGEPGDWCEHPVETCISVGEQAQYYIENNLGRQIDKAEARAQDGNDGKLLARQRRRVHLADRRFDVLGGHGQVAGCFVGDEHADFADQLAEILDAGVLVSHDGELVRHQRMIHNVDMGTEFVFLHPVTLLYRPLFCFCFLQSRAFCL